jgi:hypothetical protein
MSIDKSFENSIENILNLPYLYRIYVSCINIELLSVWTQIRTCFAFDKAVKLATIGRHDCRFNNSVSNVFLFVSRLYWYSIAVQTQTRYSIHWKRRVHFTLSLSRAKLKIIKIKQAFKNIQQPRTSRYFFGEIFKFQWKSGAAQQISQLLSILLKEMRYLVYTAISIKVVPLAKRKSRIRARKAAGNR